MGWASAARGWCAVHYARSGHPLQPAGARRSACVERREIVEPFAHAEEPDREVELAAQRGHRAAPRGAVELGDDDAGRLHRLRRTACPAAPRSGPPCRRAPAGSRGARPGSRRATTRTTFRSSSIRPSCVCSRPAVSTMTVSSPRASGRVDRVERHRRRIAAGRPRHARDAEPVGPHLQLRDGAGAIGVGRREQHLPALALEPARELGRRGGLPHAVDADHEDHRGPARRPARCRPDRSAR